MEAYITAVHKLAENCGFGVLKEELMRNIIVVGIRDKRLSEQLQMDFDLTLAKAIQKIRQIEIVKKQQTILHSDIMRDIKANVVTINTKKKERKQIWQQKANNLMQRECGRCGRKHKHSWKDCPTRDTEYQKCREKGHFAAACHTEDAKGLCKVTEIQGDRH